LTYPWDGKLSVVERHSLNLNQDIMIAKLGKRDTLLQLQSIEAVGVNFSNRPSSGGGRSSHCDFLECNVIEKRIGRIKMICLFVSLEEDKTFRDDQAVLFIQSVLGKYRSIVYIESDGMIRQ
jgi:hypothetical protein